METRVTSTKDNTNDITISVAANDVVRFYGNNESYCTVFPDIKNTNIQCSSSCYIYGNIMSLINAKDYETAKTLTGSFTFMKLFEGNTNIKSHDSKPLILPATTLTECCYSQMFRYCSGLTTAPELPAKTLTEGCYEYMFADCKSLTTAPALPATTLAVTCYEYMFYGCSGLTTAPALPATTLAVSCYENMFEYCTSLTTAPALPATELKDRCYHEMFYGCSGLNSITCLATDISADLCTNDWLSEVSREGTFYKAADMTKWTTGTSGIPEGWGVKNEGDVEE